MSPRDVLMSTPALLAVDTGGTFTDLLLQHDGRLVALKLPSTPEDPGAALLEGVRQLLEGIEAGEPPTLRVRHGTTVATNTLLERRGARVVLVTNSGIEDVLEIGRQNRPELCALSGRRPPTLVPRGDRIGLRGRVGPRGEELEALDPGELASLPERLRGAEAVAVVLLHSYANPAHEEAVAAALAGSGLPVSLSSRILPEFREYERTVTTVVNAYVAPRMGRYLRRLGERLGRLPGGGTLSVMGSAGGTLPLERALAEPVHTVLSGPAGGVVAALEWGRRCGSDHVLALDMGGTSTDVSLLPGELRYTSEGQVGGLPLGVPLLDIHTVGAGGGSMARLDPAGVLRVGPESAGAVPGPVAYGSGGTEITVTDAHLWLGRLPEGLRIAGSRELDREAVAAPMADLAHRAGVTPEAMAEGILEVADTAMERALRRISVERGVDPSDFLLVAFGGAGGLHAVELAQRLGVRAVLVPPDPGLLSAFGILASPVSCERSLTVLLPAEDPGMLGAIARSFGRLEDDACRELGAEGHEKDAVHTRRWIDARYADQGFELRIPVGEGSLGGAVTPGWVEGFHAAHERRYGFRRSAPVVAVTLRVRATLPPPRLELSVPAPRTAGPASSTIVHYRGRNLDATVLPRASLLPDTRIPGPAIITEYSATTWCPPGWSVEQEGSGALFLRPG